MAKGWRFGRSTKLRQAREGILHAGTHAFRNRKNKKRDFRQLWQIRINAIVREHGISYSTFMHSLKSSGIGLNRKMLSHIAENNPEHFEAIVKKTKVEKTPTV